MRRAFAIVGLLALALPVAVGASRIATGGLRTAIERAASPQLPAGVPQRCLVARVTTKGGRDWATVGFNVARATSCNRFGFDGVAVVRRARGGWHYVTAGSSMIPCGKLGIPSTVQRDLRIPCRVPQPTPPTRNFGVVLSRNAAGIACWMNDDGTAQGAWVFCWLGSQWPPATHAKLGLDGSFDETALIAQPFGLGGPGLQDGKSVTVGRFRCTAEAAGLSCVVMKTGKGFLIGPSGITTVGP